MARVSPEKAAKSLETTNPAAFARYQILGAMMAENDTFGLDASHLVGTNESDLPKLHRAIVGCIESGLRMDLRMVVAMGGHDGNDVLYAARLATAAYRIDKHTGSTIELLKRDQFVRNMGMIAANLQTQCEQYKNLLLRDHFKKWTNETIDAINSAFIAYSSMSGLPELPMAPVGQVDPMKVIDQSRLATQPKDGPDYSGFPEISNLIEMGQSVCTIAAETSMGKTSYVLAEAYHVAKSGRPVLYASTEMPEPDVIKRLIGIENPNVPMDKLFQRRLQDIFVPQAQLSVKRMADMPFFFVDGLLSMRELRQIAGRLDKYLRAGGRSVDGHGLNVAHDHLCMVYVDYLQQMDFAAYAKQGKTMATQISDAMVDARAMAKDCDARVVVVSQLNRDLKNRKNKEPQLSDLKESSAIEQMSNVVMFLYREDYYDDATGDDESRVEDPERPNEAWMIIRKNRNGPNNRKIPLKFIPERACYMPAAGRAESALIDSLAEAVPEPEWQRDYDEGMDTQSATSGDDEFDLSADGDDDWEDGSEGNEE